MAVLNKIRQRSLFLILIIALALFSFVLSDLFKNSSAFSSSQDVVAIVNGTKIDRTEFMTKVENAQRSQGPSASSTQTMNRVYDQEIRNAILLEQFDDLGLSVEQDQMRDLLKTSFSSYPEFQNEAGLFDENKLNEFIANLKAIQNTNQNRATLGNFQLTYNDWVNTESNIANSAKEQMFFNMIKAGVNVTLAEAEVDYLLENETIDVKYVQVPYTSIADSLVEVTKQDISNYIKAHESKYKVDASRDIKFVEFKEVATLEDEEDMKASLVKLLDNSVEFNKVTKNNDTILGFKQTENVEDFVNLNSDIKFNDNFVFKKALPAVAADSLYTKNVGDFYGPYKDNGYYKLSKIVAEKQLPDSVKVRHILISHLGANNAQPDVTRTEEEAKQLADSISNAVKSNRSKFAELVTEFSADPGSIANGGEYDFHPYGSMVQEFNDFEFENKVGDIDVVKTVFGYHVIEILDQKDKSRAVKVATIAHKIEPSEKTINDVFNATSNFEIAIQKKDFEEVAKESNYIVKPINNIKVLDENLQGLGNQRPIVRWAYEEGTKVGDYKRFSIPGGGYAVVQLVNKNKEGLMTVENASASASPEIRKEKKAKLIREKISATTIDEVAKNQKVSALTAAAINMKTPTLAGAGNEPKVVGTAFGLKEGDTSKLIDGNNGVYMVQVTKITPATKLDNYQPIANRLTAARVNAVITKMYNALKETADIEDNRANFY
jgi:parvulin-like peptidyl-prolyl isomerase